MYKRFTKEQKESSVTRYVLPSNEKLFLERRKFGGVDRTWSKGEFIRMQVKTMELGIG